ncbi:NUDIX hydrolase [Pyrofollis japonicus]|uniref:NUDIX hydrolase n=1 Tax=Pyrofollis japonicus TaxID=3060460 RepID=UPI00295AA7AB|nr:NUDIX hydrolase [Pyrofollis japonicus]BEP17409.1 NUDIX hydrolase [Pyrofollis japonicus]
MKPYGPVVGVGALVVRNCGGSELEILLVKRKYKPFAGMWSIPGGHVEPGEPLLDAAKRELLEETGIEAEPLGIIHVHEVVAEGSKGVTHYVLIDVLMGYRGGEPRAGSDALEARFVPYSEALSLELTPSARAFLEKLLELLEKKCMIEPLRTVEKT